MIWYQNYDPLHSWPVSTLVSALPVLTLFFVMLVLKKRVWVSALSGLTVSFLLASTVFHMPGQLIANASFLGIVFGMLQIGWIIVASIFLYNIAVETGQFQVMKESIAALSSDSRIQVMLIAFCFGAFLEGTGGGGAPVAIAGAFLIGLGFPPFQAAVLCLLANTAPVAWGAVGNPIRVLTGVTGIPEHLLNSMVGRILPFFSFIIPLWLVRTLVDWKRDPRSTARYPCLWWVLCADAILLVKLHGNRAGGYCFSHLLSVSYGRFSEVLEASLDPGNQFQQTKNTAIPGTPSASFSRVGHPLFSLRSSSLSGASQP